MKTKKSILVLSLFLLMGFSALAGGLKTINIKTSGTCDMCKATIEKALKAEKGVNSAYFNLATGAVKVKYDEKLSSPESLRKAINMAGYDADGQPADITAHKALPACCQKGSKCDH
jgi:copper chaperone CopZ